MKYKLNKTRILIIKKWFNNYGMRYNPEIVFRRFQIKENW